MKPKSHVILFIGTEKRGAVRLSLNPAVILTNIALKFRTILAEAG